MTPCTFKVTDVYKTPSNCFYRLFVLFMHFSRCLLQFEPFYILGIRFSTWRYKGIAVNPINKETASSRQLQVIGPYFQSPEMNTALITKQSFSCSHYTSEYLGVQHNLVLPSFVYPSQKRADICLLVYIHHWATYILQYQPCYLEGRGEISQQNLESDPSLCIHGIRTLLPCSGESEGQRVHSCHVLVCIWS